MVRSVESTVEFPQSSVAVQVYLMTISPGQGLKIIEESLSTMTILVQSSEAVGVVG